MVGVEQWAEIRRLYCVEGRSKREISTADGVASRHDHAGVGGEAPPRYARAPAGSKLDPFKDWICEQLRGGSDDPVAAAAGAGDRAWL